MVALTIRCGAEPAAYCEIVASTKYWMQKSLEAPSNKNKMRKQAQELVRVTQTAWKMRQYWANLDFRRYFDFYTNK